MKPRHWILIIVLLALAVVVPVSALNPGYRVNEWTASGSAGGVSSSASYAVHGTLAQPAVETSSGDTYTVVSGIWLGASGNVSSTVYLPLVLSAYTTFHEIADAPDACAAAMTVELAHSYRDNFEYKGALSWDQDWYTFDAVLGTTYTIETFDLEWNNNTYLYLYEDDCSTKIRDINTGGTGEDDSVDWTATGTDAFCVGVEHWNWAVYGPGTYYTLRVKEAK